MNAKAYCVVYRTGGTLNFKWHRTAATNFENAKQWVLDIERQGYKALMVDHALSVSIGLPETYE